MAVGKRRTGSQLGHLGLAVAGIWALRVRARREAGCAHLGLESCLPRSWSRIARPCAGGRAIAENDI
jgi:hypothetical protein